MSAGLFTTVTPASPRTLIFAAAVPLPPAMIAPACPIRRPGGAVCPQMKPTTGFFTLALMNAARVEALVVHPDALMIEQRAAIARFSLERRIPVISGWAALAEGGSLMTYGPNLQVCYRRLAYFVDRILRGAKPAELPIELPNTVELVVNLKSAQALGITVPPSILLRADRVIV